MRKNSFVAEVTLIKLFQINILEIKSKCTLCPPVTFTVVVLTDFKELFIFHTIAL